MNVMLVLGLLVAFGAIFFSLPAEASIAKYMKLKEFILIFGGTVGCAMAMSASVKDFGSVISILSGWMYFKRKNLTHFQAVKILVKIAEEASLKGKSNVLQMGKDVGDGFLDRALDLMGSGLEAEFVRNVLEADIDEQKKRHLVPITIVRNMATLSPMFGILGNVLGVVLLLENIQDVNSVAEGMSLALISTTYGLLFSSTIFLPISSKLRFLSEEDALTKEIIKEGILAIMANEIPLKVEKRLMSYLSTGVKKKMGKKK